MKYQIWMEGYQCNGDSMTAHFIGEEEGKDFPDAVRRWYLKHPKEFLSFDPERLTWWGCRHFDNESDARELAG